MQLDLYYSTRELATDNALMIALTCANQIENGHAPTKEFLAVGSKDYKWSH
jgi:tRNA A37 threonylcarbamoyltransferase TsaD